jgi:hypothetical protein
MPLLYDLEALQHQSSWKPQADSLEQKSVRFCDDVNIKKISNVPVENRLSYWMVKEDYARIRDECMNTVQMSLNRCSTSVVDFRGLEHKTPQGIYRRQLNRMKARKAVLQEQAFQAETGYSDPDWIASVYREITHRSTIEAKIMGMKDEIALNHAQILNGSQNLQDFKKQSFKDFKNIAISYIMFERMEL